MATEVMNSSVIKSLASITFAWGVHGRWNGNQELTIKCVHTHMHVCADGCTSMCVDVWECMHVYLCASVCESLSLCLCTSVCVCTFEY